jgi:hypothetical protein
MRDQQKIIVQPNDDLRACAARFDQEGPAYDRAIVQFMREVLWKKLVETGDLTVALKAVPVIVSAHRNLVTDNNGVNEQDIEAKVAEFLGARVRPAA